MEGLESVAFVFMLGITCVTRRMIDLGAGRSARSPRSEHPSNVPRKEVIQPHLPVRLPCYDFTPLTGHSFGASVPYGFGQRLREHQTRVM